MFSFRKKKSSTTGGAANGASVGSVDKQEKKNKSFFSAAKDFVDNDDFLRENIQKQYLFVLLLFVLSMVYINNRFIYERELRQLAKSKTELADLKYRSLTISKQLKVAGRRTSISRELLNQGSDLQEATSPIIIISE